MKQPTLFLAQAQRTPARTPYLPATRTVPIAGCALATRIKKVQDGDFPAGKLKPALY
jgi:hypothetical protein